MLGDLLVQIMRTCLGWYEGAARAAATPRPNWRGPFYTARKTQGPRTILIPVRLEDPGGTLVEQ